MHQNAIEISLKLLQSTVSAPTTAKLSEDVQIPVGDLQSSDWQFQSGLKMHMQAFTGLMMALQVVLLMRLGPAPYAWLSYACSLSTDIHYGPYIAASIIGRSPHNLIDIYIGSGMGAAGDAAKCASSHRVETSTA